MTDETEVVPTEAPAEPAPMPEAAPVTPVVHESFIQEIEAAKAKIEAEFSALLAKLKSFL